MGESLETRTRNRVGALRRRSAGGTPAISDADHHEVLAYLRARYNGAFDSAQLEDFVQDAWLTLIRLEKRGGEVGDRIAYMRGIAWRMATDALHERREEASDPADSVLERIEDPSAGPAARLESRAELARAIEAVECLEPEQRAAYRARFVDELSTVEACERLGIPRSTYRHRLRRALDAVHATLDPNRFARHQVKLLGAYVAGIASLPERRRAERLIREDPQSAAVARELHRAHEGTAAALAPVAIDPEGPVRVVDRIAAIPDRIRDAVHGVTGRGAGDTDTAGTILSGGAATRGAGAGAGGLAAQLAGLGGAGKLAVACLGGGAAATACVAAGVLPAPGLGGSGDDAPGQKPPRDVAHLVRVEDPPRIDETADPEAPPETETPAEEQPQDDSAEDATTTTTPSSPIAPTTPPVEQEFGVASAATSGGGSSSSGGGGSAAQQEFGDP